MPDLDMLTEIHTDVKYLREGMDELKKDFKSHVTNDNERFKPLENAHQQAIGRKALWVVIVSLVSAISGWMGGGHGH